MGLPRVIAEALAAKLKAEVPGFAEVYPEWPEANQQLVYPSASVMISPDVNFERCAPYLRTQGALVGTQAESKYVIGAYNDIPIQLDIWTKYKIQRDEYYELVWNALQPVDGAGLMLKLTAYHDEWLSITTKSFKFMSLADAVERKEWRVVVNLVASCRAVKSRSDYIMTQDPVLVFDTPDTID